MKFCFGLSAIVYLGFLVSGTSSAVFYNSLKRVEGNNGNPSSNENEVVDLGDIRRSCNFYLKKNHKGEGTILFACPKRPGFKYEPYDDTKVSPPQRNLNFGERSPSHKFECPFPWGTFRHPTDCSKFYLCLFSKPTLKSCHGSEFYDEVKQECSRKETVHCENRTGDGGNKDEDDSPPFKCPYTWGSFPYPKDCSKYYLCLSKKPYVKACKLSELYDAYKQECRYKDKVDCGSRYNPKEKSTTSSNPSTSTEQETTSMSTNNEVSSSTPRPKTTEPTTILTTQTPSKEQSTSEQNPLTSTIPQSTSVFTAPPHTNTHPETTLTDNDHSTQSENLGSTDGNSRTRSEVTEVSTIKDKTDSITTDQADYSTQSEQDKSTLSEQTPSSDGLETIDVSSTKTDDLTSNSVEPSGESTSVYTTESGRTTHEETSTRSEQTASTVNPSDGLETTDLGSTKTEELTSNSAEPSGKPTFVFTTESGKTNYEETSTRSEQTVSTVNPSDGLETTDVGSTKTEELTSNSAEPSGKPTFIYTTELGTTTDEETSTHSEQTASTVNPSDGLKTTDLGSTKTEELTSNSAEPSGKPTSVYTTELGTTTDEEISTRSEQTASTVNPSDGLETTVGGSTHVEELTSESVEPSGESTTIYTTKLETTVHEENVKTDEGTSEYTNRPEDWDSTLHESSTQREQTTKQIIGTRTEEPTSSRNPSTSDESETTETDLKTISSSELEFSTISSTSIDDNDGLTSQVTDGLSYRTTFASETPTVISTDSKTEIETTIYSTQYPETFICPKRNGNFPHPVDCSKYFACRETKATVEDCSPGTLFNTDFNVCFDEQEVDCESRKRPDEGTKPTETNVEITTDYSKYYSSSNPTSDSKRETGTQEATLYTTEETITDKQTTVDYISETEDDETSVKAEITGIPSVKPKERCDPADKTCITGDDGNVIKCPKAYGLFPHPTNPQKFLQCDNFTVHLMTCAGGLVFDPIHTVCVWPK